MPIIENYAEHPFEFPQGSPVAIGEKGETSVKAIQKTHALIIPWRVKPGEPSKVRVSDESLKLMQADSVAKGWFSPGNLALGAEPEKPEERAKIPTLPSPPAPKKSPSAAAPKEQAKA
jgi:hypothetical protein